MSIEKRRLLIQRLERARGSKVICYLTSIRPNAPGSMSDDAVREFLDHLLTIQNKPIEKLDLFLVSNGGDGTVPWRLVPIFREFSTEFNVLVPYRAYSAATIMALGANQIIMHPFGALGPIDPTVTNEFNPMDVTTNRKLGISVEDVKAYISFIKDTVGIKHEEELVRVVEILVNKVHPLALGNVERFISQSRMIARKLLKLHTDIKDEHTLEGIIEALASKLYFHGHPINRVEAIELGLKVAETVSPEIETLMWELFVEFEIDMKSRVSFDPAGQLALHVAPNSFQPGFWTELARVEDNIVWAIVESAKLSSSYRSQVRHVLNAGPQGDHSISATTLNQAWYQTEAPASP